MNPISRNSISAERVIIALPGLAILAALVGFTLHSWMVIFVSFAAMIIVPLIPKMRLPTLGVLLSAIGVVTWGFVSGFYRAFEKSHSTFQTVYLIAVGIFFSVILLSLFGYVLGATLLRPQEPPENTNANQASSKETVGPESQDFEAPNEDVFDPYAVLNVQPGATHEEIRSAYRKQMQLYHPDRVEHLGEALKQTAHQQALLIQRAVDELLPD